MANLAAVLDDTSSNGKKIKQIYDDLKLSMTGANGQMKSGYELLSDLAGEWSGLSSDTQKYIATTIAGTTQLNNFVALMNNFGHATKATETALDSAGSAAEENARYMGGLEAQTTAVKAEFESLANNVIPNELISAFLKAGKAILSFVNNDVGAFITRFALVGTVILGGGNILIGYIAKIKDMIVAVKAASGAMATLQASLGWVSLALGIVAAVAAAAVPSIIEAWNESHKSVAELADEIKDLNSQLQTNKERIAEINAMNWSERTAEINAEYYALMKQNDELERNIKLKQKQTVEKADSDKIQTGIGYKVEYTLTEQTSASAAAAGVIGHFRLMTETFDSYEEALARTKELENEINVSGLSVIQTTEEYATGIAEVTPLINEYNNILEQNGELSTSQNEDFIILMDSASDYYTSLKQLQEAFGRLSPSQEAFISAYEKANSTFSRAKKAVDLFGVSIKTVESTLPDLVKYLDDSGYSIDAVAAYCRKSKKDINKLADALYGAAIAAQELKVAAAETSYNTLLEADRGFAPRYRSTILSQGSAQLSKEQQALKKLQEQRENFIKSVQEAWAEEDKKVVKGTGDTKTLTQAEKNLQEFRSQLAYLDHDLAMNNINTEQYYYHLQKIMDMYLQDAENVETLWKYQEKIYKHSQEELQNYYQEQLDQQNALIDKINERFDAEIEGLEKSNDELEKQIEYEQLLEDMASAKAKKSLVFKNGAFQYVEDVDAISSAQNALRKYYRQQEVEQRKQNIEAARQRELYEPQQLVSRLEEIIKNIKGYATGTTYSAGGLSLVGEHGAELAVLSKGTGVIPADITKNLWAWGQTTPSALMSTVAGVNTQNGGIYFSGVTMSFPSVRNGNDAQSFMQSVVNLAYQRAYSRK